MSFLDNLRMIDVQAESFMKDLELEISIRNVEEWSRKLKKEQKKRNKNKNEMPLDIKHSL